MKKHLLKLAVVFGVLALAAQAQASVITPITPGDATLTDPGGTSNSGVPGIVTYIEGQLSIELNELYKQDLNPALESGTLAGNYSNDLDESGGTISWDGGAYISPEAYMLVKDGNQNPDWYFYNLTTLGWDGQDDLVLSGFWPGTGSISHVSLYGSTDTPRLPEPGTLLLLGSGLVGLALYGRKTFKR